MTQPHIAIPFPETIAREFPEQFEVAWRTVADTIAFLPVMEFAPLERRSPALRGYDWAAYLRCSVARMVRMLKAAQEQAPPPVTVLDVGAYFGNFALMFQRAGYQVTALDSYADYAPAFTAAVEQMTRAGVTVSDFRDAGYDFGGLAGEFDVIVCAGVIEHIPHTPRLLLDAIVRRLRPGGILLLDTPNLAYLYTRQKLMRGESIFAPVHLQYVTELPFEGHHREYTAAEIAWMIEHCGLQPVTIDTFNYSVYSAGVLTGIHADNYREMQADPSARELIFCVARKPGAVSGGARPR